MDTHMELSKKTTILLSPRLYELLKREAETRRASIGELIRTACEKQYGLSREPEAVEAVAALASLDLPVGTPAAMKRESVPDPDDLVD